MASNYSDSEKRRAVALRRNLKRRKAAAGSQSAVTPSPPRDTAQEPSLVRPNKAQKPN